MYDDLSSLTEKLKLSGVSFQVMKEEKEGDTPVAVNGSLTGEVMTANSHSQAKDHSSMNAANGQKPGSTIVQMAAKSSPQRRKDVQSVALSSRGSTTSASYEPTMRENIAAMQRASHRQAAENNPVKLDMLFASIGNKNI